MVLLPEGEAKGVKPHAPSERWVDPPKIDDQRAIDEDPYVVVATKRERLAAKVAKAEVNLRREEEVVRFAEFVLKLGGKCAGLTVKGKVALRVEA